MLEEMSVREERPPAVKFELRAVEDIKASEKAGRFIGKDVEYALVTPPYSRDCFEFKAEQWFANQEKNVRNGRLPEKWLSHWKECYKAWKNGLEAPLNGTDVRNWPMASPAEIKQMRGSGIMTIEDMAAINDEGMRRMGMGALKLRDKARAYLQAAKDHGPLVAEIAALKKENSNLKTENFTLKNQVDALKNQDSEPVSGNIGIEDILDDSDLSLDESEGSLEEQYERTFGKPPHHKMKAETIQQRLAEANQ